MLIQKVAKSSLLILMCLSLSGCGDKSKTSSNTVSSQKADVVLNNAVEVDSYEEGNNESHVMLPKEQKIYHFAFDSSQLDRKAKESLKREAKYLKQHANARVLLAGHTDLRGTHEYNIKLGEHRNNSVAKYLHQQGVPYSQIEKISYGKEKPMTNRDSENEHAQNRRVELSYQSVLSV